MVVILSTLMALVSLSTYGNAESCGNQVNGQQVCPFHLIPGCTQNVTIKPGDTLNGIANMYGWTDAQSLVTINPGLDITQNIYPGSTLCVCGPPDQNLQCPKPPPSCNKMYNIKYGDTCFAIAVSFDYQGPDPAARLIALNKELGVNIDCTNLQPGSSICVDCFLGQPSPTKASAPPKKSSQDAPYGEGPPAGGPAGDAGPTGIPFPNSPSKPTAHSSRTTIGAPQATATNGGFGATQPKVTATTQEGANLAGGNYGAGTSVKNAGFKRVLSENNISGILLAWAVFTLVL